MSQGKKVEKIIQIAQTEYLGDYEKLLKEMRKQLPLFGGTKRLAAALLKEYVGDISKLNLEKVFEKKVSGKIVFEDIKDGRARLFINVGKNHRISTGDLIREIVKKSGIDGKQIGKIDIHATYSFFEVSEQYAEIVYHSFDGAKLKGLNVVVEPAKKKKVE